MKFVMGIVAVMMMFVFQVNAQVMQKEILGSGYIVKTVEDEEGTKIVLKTSIVHSSEESNLKLKSVHISNQDKNYLEILNQVSQAKKSNQFIRINKVNKNIEIEK